MIEQSIEDGITIEMMVNSRKKLCSLDVTVTLSQKLESSMSSEEAL